MLTLTEEVMSQIDLRKTMVINLTKELGIGDQRANVMLALDISGSQEDRLKSGLIQTTLERLIPIALKFDDNNAIDVFPFHTEGFQHDVALTMDTLSGYVKKEILRKYTFGGTSYQPVISKIRRAVKNGGFADAQPKSSGGFFSKLFGGGGKQQTETPVASGINIRLPTYVIFLTDGDSFDHPQTKAEIIAASKEPIFWQFVGINDGQQFTFLETLDTMPGRFIDNANFFQINDLNQISDEQLYRNLLGEFPQWLKEARAKNLID